MAYVRWVGGWLFLLAVACGEKAPPPKPPEKPKVVNVNPGPGAAPAHPKGFGGKGKVIYEDKGAGGQVYHVMVRNPQTQAIFIAVVIPLQREVQAYFAEHSKYPDRLEDLESWPAYERQIPHMHGLKYDNKKGLIDLVRYSAGRE